jgi:hypothetical protein
LSDWLSSPEEIPQLLTALQSAGWIRRGQSPEKSRFWHLLTDEQAAMFGVFDGYEQQLLADWITQADTQEPAAGLATNRFRRRPAVGPVARAPALHTAATVEQIVAQHAVTQPGPGSCAEVDFLFEQLAAVNTKAQAFAVLGGLLSPANHPTPAGLAATRLYADLLIR